MRKKEFQIKRLLLILGLMTTPQIWAGGLNVFYVQDINTGIIPCAEKTGAACETISAFAMKNADAAASLYLINKQSTVSKTSLALTRYIFDEKWNMESDTTIKTMDDGLDEKYERLPAFSDKTVFLSTDVNYFDKQAYGKLITLSDSTYSLQKKPETSVKKTPVNLKDNAQTVKLDQKNKEKKSLTAINDASTAKDNEKKQPNLKNLINEALNTFFGKNIGYFKIQSWAVFGDKTIFFSIQEIGTDAEDKELASIIIKGEFIRSEDRISISPDTRFEVVADFSELFKRSTGKNIAISGMGINPFNKSLYMLTTYKTDTPDGLANIGSYLWSARLTAAGNIDLESISMAKYQDNSSLQFSKKSDAIAFFNEDIAAIIHHIEEKNTPDKEVPEKNPRDKASPQYTIIKLTTYRKVRF